MGLSQSYLSQSAYGYDTVSSVDVNGLNGILKKYYTNSATKFTATTLYFIKDSTGNPQVIELADLLKQTNSIDPLTVKSTDAASVNTIKKTVFFILPLSLRLATPLLLHPLNIIIYSLSWERKMLFTHSAARIFNWYFLIQSTISG